MENQITCPVCGKSGIPDYHKEEVNCPCCGSDLSIYKMLHDSQQPKNEIKKSNLWKIATAAFAVVAISAIGYCFYSNKNSNIENNVKASVELLNDSIKNLQSQLASIKEEFAESQKNLESVSNSSRVYIVKKGDSFCKISKTVFGTENRYKDIAEWNELSINTILHTGDTLKIN